MHQIFVLTPYKVVTANFLSKYLDNRWELLGDSTQVHHQIAFQLIMSLDLSFEELMDIVQSPLTLRDPNDESGNTYLTEVIDKEFLTQFRLGLSNLTQTSLLSSFMDRIDFTKDANDKEFAEIMRKNCHPKSMIGMFLRRIVIHFKRLSFNETAMLVRNLSSYIKYGDPVPETPGDHSKSDEVFKFPDNDVQVNNVANADLNANTSSQPTRIVLENIALEKLRAIEKKLIKEHCSKIDDRKREVELRHQIFVISKIIKEKESCQKLNETEPKLQDTSTLANGSFENKSRDNTDVDESDIQLVDAWNNSSIKTVQNTALEMEMNRSDKHSDDNCQEEQARDGRRNKALNVTQQYLIHQVNMIMNNEKRSLPPEVILNMVEHFYTKHHVFAYQQSIHSNYRMNVRLNHRNAQLDSASSLTNSDNQEGNDITNIFSKSFAHVQTTNNFHNDLNYLKFINALRMNDYPMAQESLHQYFDNKDFSFSQALSSDPFGKSLANKKKSGALDGQSEGNNNCWALLNIGIMHAHFQHFDLAYEALEDCVRISRDSNENKCLQYEMIWMLYVLEQLECPQGTNAENDDCQGRFWKLFNSIYDDVSNKEGSKITVEEYFVTSNLMKLIQINERKLPYVAAMGYLHLEKQLYKQQNRPSERRMPLAKLLNVEKQLSAECLRPPLNIKPMLLASRYMMDDVLQKQYSMHSAILNAYGAHHLAVVTSKLLARIDFSGVLQEKKFAHCNENHAIAFRNIAFYQWRVCGDSAGALHLLEFFSDYISQYDQRMNSIVRSARTEIEFDVATLTEQWQSAKRLANTMRQFNVHHSGILLAKLEILQRNYPQAAELLQRVVADEQLSRVAQNVEHNESLMKSFKKTKTTIKISEPKLKKMPKINLNARGRGRQSWFKEPEKRKNNAEKIIIQSSRSSTSVLSPETDPFMWVYGKLLLAQTSGNPFDLFNVVELAQNWGFRQLEIKGELELISVQIRKFGQYCESQARLDELIIKVIASGVQEDIAQAYYLSAVNHYFIHKNGNLHKCSETISKLSPDKQEIYERSKKRIAAEMPLKGILNCDMDYRNYYLLIARWAIMRAMVIFRRINSRNGMLECCALGHEIEHLFEDYLECKKADNIQDKKYDMARLQAEQNEHKERLAFYVRKGSLVGAIGNIKRVQ